ncbi:MAG: hypothetical protein Q8L14_12635 [Myxococcales bacterium]|nr:hypothetical protein [Myxococcales bacterium]
MKVSSMESVQEVGGTPRLRASGWRSEPLKLQSMTWSMLNDEPDSEIAEHDSGHHFELSKIEVIEDEPPCSARRGSAGGTDTLSVTPCAFLQPEPRQQGLVARPRFHLLAVAHAGNRADTACTIPQTTSALSAASFVHDDPELGDQLRIVAERRVTCSALFLPADRGASNGGIAAAVWFGRSPEKGTHHEHHYVDRFDCSGCRAVRRRRRLLLEPAALTVSARGMRKPAMFRGERHEIC